MMEHALERVIHASSTACSAVAQSPWLVNLDLNCNLSTETLVGVIVFPLAALLLAFDLWVSGLNARAKRRMYARRLGGTIDQNRSGNQAHSAGRGVQPGRSGLKPAQDREAQEDATMFEPTRVMKCA